MCSKIFSAGNRLEERAPVAYNEGSATTFQKSETKPTEDTRKAMKKNYQQWLDHLIEQNVKEGKRPSLLLHCCCAPCSTYVLEYLNKFFNITAYYYNPNISQEGEYVYRWEELKRLLTEAPLETPVELLKEPYDHEVFLERTRDYQDLPEGSQRCYQCYSLRLEQTALAAQKENFDFFSTTLSISPYKNSLWLNEIGERMGQKQGVSYLFSDFKKKNGYKRSYELSQEYGLYRQDYCGCEFSQREAEARRNRQPSEGGRV